MLTKLLSVCLIVSSCMLQAQNKVSVKPFSDGVSKDILYTARLRYKEFTFSGLFAVKSGQEGYHVYFVSKTGFSIVEAILKKDSTIWRYTIPALSKEKVKKKLDTEFRLLVQSPLKYSSFQKYTEEGIKVRLPNGDRVLYEFEKGKITAAKTLGFLHLVRTRINYIPGENGLVPETIYAHKTLIDVEISLAIHEN